MDLQASTRKGALTGVRVLWELTKVTVPTFILINILSRSGLLSHVTQALGPVMALFGLPGEAALVLVTANFVGFYPGVAALAALALPWKQLTILSMMVMLCHSILTETALIAKTGARASWIVVIRVVSMVAAGVLFNALLPGP